MELLDRVVVKEDFEAVGVSTIRADTIGTVRNISDKMLTVQINFYDEKQKLITATASVFRKATVEDLDKIETVAECIKIVNPLFHPNSKYISVDDEIITIRGMKLATNEAYDLFKIEDKDGIREDFVGRKFIDSLSHIPFTEEIIEPKVKPNKINQKESFQDESDIKIEINGFEFNIRDDKINLGIITKDELQGYMNALTKLTKFLN